LVHLLRLSTYHQSFLCKQLYAFYLLAYMIRLKVLSFILFI
jgi:hypothetical protein